MGAGRQGLRLESVPVTGLLELVLGSPAGFTFKRLGLFARGVLHLGRRYRCPVCGWSLRSFTTRRGLFTRTVDGYCPRCDAKARHRRIWLYLSRHTDLSSGQHRLLEIAPVWAFARRFRGMSGISYTGIDLRAAGPHVTVVGGVADLPLDDESMDEVLCIHVLEHVRPDRQAMAELYRVLAPGGWALISVPLRLDQPTYEDVTVTDPSDRLRLFGEEDHVRFYGLDLRDRLEDAGFAVECDRADDLPEDDCRRFGLRRDEHLFLCRKG
jgi:SAM-dependent methyltransferase